MALLTCGGDAFEIQIFSIGSTHVFLQLVPLLPPSGSEDWPGTLPRTNAGVGAGRPCRALGGRWVSSPAGGLTTSCVRRTSGATCRPGSASPLGALVRSEVGSERGQQKHVPHHLRCAIRICVTPGR